MIHFFAWMNNNFSMSSNKPTTLNTITDLRFRVFARAIILDGNTNVLMLKKHLNQKIAPGKWVLPGGAIEFGESPEEALLRELQEEVHLKATGFELIASETRVIENVHWVGLIYKVSGDLKTIRNGEPEKHSEIQWCDKNLLTLLLDEEESKLLLKHLNL